LTQLGVKKTPSRYDNCPVGQVSDGHYVGVFRLGGAGNKEVMFDSEPMKLKSKTTAQNFELGLHLPHFLQLLLSTTKVPLDDHADFAQCEGGRGQAEYCAKVAWRVDSGIPEKKLRRESSLWRRWEAITPISEIGPEVQWCEQR
jgi:hypothetical protein